MNEKELEIAEANRVQVLETNVLHASDVIYWLDGSSADNTAEMQRVGAPLDIRFSARPAGLSVLSTPGKTALWRRSEGEFIEGRATEAQRARPPQASFAITGEAWDYSRRFNPVRFDLSAGAGNGLPVVMYPSTFGAVRPAGGVIFGSLRVDGTEAPVIWGMLELVITVSVSESLTVRAQTDAKGDFVLSLKRLPPLPESITEYLAQLTLTAGLANAEDNAPDLSTYVAMELESLDTEGDFVASLPLTVRPGERARLNSAGKSYLAAQSA